MRAWSREDISPGSGLLEVGGAWVGEVMMETVSDCVAVRAEIGWECGEGVFGLETTEEDEVRGRGVVIGREGADVVLELGMVLETVLDVEKGVDRIGFCSRFFR